jgi:hypothetical protein
LPAPLGSVIKSLREYNTLPLLQVITFFAFRSIMPACPTNRTIAAAAIAAASQEPPTMPPAVATALAAAIEAAESPMQPTTNAVVVSPASLLPALSPSRVSDDVIDYYTSDGIKLYSASVATLPIKDFE